MPISLWCIIHQIENKMKSLTMKAVVMKTYGSPDVLEIQEVAKPSPEANEILIKIHATTVTTADTLMRKADPCISRFFVGFNRAKNPITGTGFAGSLAPMRNTLRSPQKD